MKKNIMMRLSALLLVAVLLTTCVISGTFAKYVSSDSAFDEARVAKWGVTVVVNGDDAFGTKYDNEIAVEGTKVVSNGTHNVLAPGTKGTLGSVAITGTPEVRVEVAVDLKLELSGWTVDGNFYCPLEISDGTTTVKGLDYTKAEDFIAAVEALVDSAAAEVAANTNLGTTYDVVLTWNWAFDTNDDVKDTALADLAAAGTNSTIKATWAASVVQVD